MPGSLNDPLLKLKRAREHLVTLNDLLRVFNSQHPTRVRDSEDVDKGLYVRHFEMPIIDPYLAVVAGDAIYALRSSLDHMAWQLALTATETPFAKTEFPVVDRATSENLSRFRRITKSLPARAVAEIEGLQPYHRGDTYQDDLLWKLDKLCNIDKHRVIPAQGTVLEFKIPRGVKPELTFAQNMGIMTMPIDVKERMKLAPHPAGGVLFGSDVDGCVIDAGTLGAIFDYIEQDVFPRFTQFFNN